MRRMLAIGLALAVPTVALARMIAPMDEPPQPFELTGRPLGDTKPAAATAAFLTASRIMATADGALVSDADSGMLLATDKLGAFVSQLKIGPEAGLLTYDASTRTAFVADRRGDRIVAVTLTAGKLVVARSWATPGEPYAVALTPDRKTVLVVTIADRTLVAYAAETGVERWRTPLGREPRGLAISPDGTRALVSFLGTGTVDEIDLLETRRAKHIALSVAEQRTQRRADTGDAFARASFAVTYMGDHQAVVPFQRETPVQTTNSNERVGSYGGGVDAPITQHLAFLRDGEQVIASTTTHQPRALAWDGAQDALYVAGLGSETLLQINHASQVSITGGNVVKLPAGCGPDGVAIADPGQVLVWCSFSRSISRVTFSAKANPVIVTGPVLASSTWTAAQHQGLELFHAAKTTISSDGALACASCHPDNRADGLSWRIDKHTLQTPVLAGRVVGTHPFKWDGGDKTLTASLTGTMKRLGGGGLSKVQTAALAAYIEALPSVRAPSRPPEAVSRGKQLFDAEGCRSCHGGAAYTDQDRHKLTGTLAQSDTPSLRGLAASAPYYHDGSAATLEALLRDRGDVHGMADTTDLTDAQISDLTAFLETL